MPDYTVSADVDSMLRSANDAAIRSAIGVGTTDAPTFLAQTLSDGSAAAPSLKFSNSSISGLFGASGGTQFTAGGANVFGVRNEVRVAGTVAFGFSTSDPTTTGLDVLLWRDGAPGILAQRNLGFTQAFRLYNATSATPLTDWDRASLSFTSGNFRIAAENSGTTGYNTARGIDFVTGGAIRMSIWAAGTVHIQGSMSMGGNYDSIAPSGSAGYLSLSGNNGAGLSASGTLIFRSKPTINIAYMPLAFSGETSAFPAIKRNGTGIDIRLADDSAFAPVKGKITTDTAYTATVVTPTGFLTLYDSTGTAYRVPCVV